MRPPDTDIPCEVCKGTKINPEPHPHECGACFGTGLSTASYDQRRNGTTITIRTGVSHCGHFEGKPEERTFPPGTEFHGPGREVSDGKRRGMCYLISWPNLNYRGGPGPKAAK